MFHFIVVATLQTDFRGKDQQLRFLQANESSLKYTVDILNKRETLNDFIINTCGSNEYYFPLELKSERKMSLQKSYELEIFKKQMTDLNKTPMSSTHTPATGLY